MYGNANCIMIENSPNSKQLKYKSAVNCTNNYGMTIQSNAI